MNRLPSFGTVKVKVKAYGGFTFVNPFKPRPADGHPLRDEKGKAYTDKFGKVLFFERTTLAHGATETVPKTPEVEAGLSKEIRIGRRDPISRQSKTIMQLVEIKPKPSPIPAKDKDEDIKKSKGGK